MNPDADSPASVPLTATRVTADANLAGSLQKLAVAARDMLANCTSASVTLIAARRPVTMAATDDVAAEIDLAQYEAADGPCLTSAR